MFEILEHTADIGFRARAATLAELFEECAKALVAIYVEAEGIEPRERFEFEARGEDREALLVNFLSEVLWLVDGRRIGLRRFQILELGEDRLRCEALGEPLDPVRHRAKLIVKAVTYHQLRIAQEDGGWVAEVYVDI